ATVRVGTSSHGQGHATSFAMVAADSLGIVGEQVDFLQSDTARIPRGGGTVGSRSGQLAGSAVLEASRQVLRRARDLVAAHFEASVDDVTLLSEGRIGINGSPAYSLTWAEIATLAVDNDTPLVVEHIFDQ